MQDKITEADEPGGKIKDMHERTCIMIDKEIPKIWEIVT